MSNWPILTLDDVCEKITDGAHNSPKSVEYGKPMASVKDLTHFGVDLTQARLISQADFDKLVKQGCQPHVGDVLIAKDGNSALDTVCTVDQPLDAVLLSSVAILRPNKNKLDSDFLKYYFCSKQVIEYLKSNFISGAAIPRVVLKDFKRAKIKIPPLEVQKEISKKLRALDDKINLNRQINQTLEQIAQAIFKSWFVDFDPVKAKIEAKKNGQDPESAAMCAICGKSEEELDELNPEQLQQLSTIAARFPDELEESELDEIPKGWTAGKLGDLYSAKGGYAYKSKDFISEGNPVVKIKNITGTGTVDLISVQYIGDEIASKSGRFALSDGDLIMAMTGATVGKIGFVVTNNNVTPYLNQRVARFESNFKENEPAWFVFCLFQLQSKFEELVGNASGSAQPNISSTGIENTSLVVAARDIVTQFNNTVDSLFQKWIVNNKENSILLNLRTTLLPKLLSGEIEIVNKQNLEVT